MTVCIAAKVLTSEDRCLVLCMDMMGATDLSSAETVWKMHSHGADFYALIAGTVSTARELATCCLNELEFGREEGPYAVSVVSQRVRRGIGSYKRKFAEAHVQSRLGMSYGDFRKSGKSDLPDDLYREVFWEIKNHYSQAELVVGGFLGDMPVITKVTSDSAWDCDDFAVIGSGTTIGEAALLHREQNFLQPFQATLYHVYEAKRLAEKAPSVGKRTTLYVARPGGHMDIASDTGLKVLEDYFQQFSPRPFDMKLGLPAGMFF